MKGIILAGGTGSRLAPLTFVTNKHLLPVYSKPMIDYPLGTLMDMGINDIMLITGKEHVGDFADYLGSGREYGIDLTYKVQDKPLGIAQALSLAEEWADEMDVAVILGDNIFESIPKKTTFFPGAKLHLKQVDNPQRFGVPVFNNDLSIQYIEEKPIIPKSAYAVTGLYFYDRLVFSYIKQLKPSDRGEYEISDVNNMYIHDNRLSYEVMEGYWSDAGTFESLFEAARLVAGK